MQTKFFRTMGIDTSELENDLHLLQRVPADELAAIGRFLAEGEHLVQRDESMKAELDRFLRESHITGEQYTRARRLSLFLVQACQKFDDEPAALIEDLNSVAPLGTDVRTFLMGVCGAVLRAVQIRRRETLAKRSIPALEGLTYSCDVRVDMPEFDVFGDDPGSRASEPRGWLPIILMRFSTDEEAELVCQVDLRHLRRAINALRAAEKDLLKVEHSLSVAGLVESEQE